MTGSNNIILRKFNVKPCGLDEIYGKRSNRRWALSNNR